MDLGADSSYRSGRDNTTHRQDFRRLRAGKMQMNERERRRKIDIRNTGIKLLLSSGHHIFDITLIAHNSKPVGTNGKFCLHLQEMIEYVFSRSLQTILPNYLINQQVGHTYCQFYSNVSTTSPLAFRRGCSESVEVPSEGGLVLRFSSRRSRTSVPNLSRRRILNACLGVPACFVSHHCWWMDEEKKREPRTT